MRITYRGFADPPPPPPPPIMPFLGRGRGGSSKLLFSLQACVWKGESPLFFFFFKKQTLCQICNQIQIGTNARSEGSQRELFILRTAFPPGQKVPACAWHDGSALPESPKRVCLVLKCLPWNPFSPGSCLTLAFPKSFGWEGTKGVYLLSWGFTCHFCLKSNLQPERSRKWLRRFPSEQTSLLCDGGGGRCCSFWNIFCWSHLPLCLITGLFTVAQFKVWCWRLSLSWVHPQVLTVMYKGIYRPTKNSFLASTCFNNLGLFSKFWSSISVKGRKC